MTNSYFAALQARKLSRCPYHKSRMDTVDWCELNEAPCDVALGNYDCEEWRLIQKEWLKEEHEYRAKTRGRFKIVKPESK